ncbi:septal ring lytic transglycosylase RlpA family protein [Candidatus Peregrinibacteria bacterium]|nr:septal ring lytic transglycosylase RlpA family protein [Candidatus Peregrinibacteria bacterium]
MKIRSKKILCIHLAVILIALNFGFQQTYAGKIAQEEKIFEDVDITHPYFESIRYLKEHFIIKGYEDGTFQPEKTVIRAEALKMIMLGANYHFDENFGSFLKNEGATLDVEKKYPDVDENLWYFPYVWKATEMGIVEGYPDGNFRGELSVNLAEALKMIAVASDITIKKEVEGKPFMDVENDAWFAPYAEYFKNIYILTEDENGNISPDQPLTRGKLSYLMYGIIRRAEFLENGKNANIPRFVYGKASFYGGEDGFNGKGTSSGETFDDSLMTAAHKTLPFNTWIRVYFMEDPNKYVDVRINDRGPYDDRLILDLSLAAFETFAPSSRGIIPIKYTIIEPPS